MANEDLLASVRALYPWAERLGLLDLVIEKIRDDASPDEVLAAIRQTDEWRAQFPAFYAEDGSKRFSTEAQYMQNVDDLRDVMKEFGVYDAALDAPMNYVGLIESGQDPNEFRSRFETYRALENGTRDLRAAFYVYGGLAIDTDDVYRMTVDPGYQQAVVQQYDENVAQSPPDYETFMNRVTEVALAELTEGVGEAIDAGIVPGSFLEQLINMDPNTARGWIDVIHTAGDGVMSLDALNRSFQYAMLASAATEQGFGLPTRERVQEYVQAGVSRAKAVQAYSIFAQNRFGLAGMAQRAGVQKIDQSMFEEAVLLQDGQAQAALQKATDRERALGQQGGGFATRLQGSRVEQYGR